MDDDDDTLCGIFAVSIPQGEYPNFKWIVHWTFPLKILTPSGPQFNQDVGQIGCKFQIVLHNMPIHLKITHPL